MSGVISKFADSSARQRKRYDRSGTMLAHQAIDQHPVVV
jgi:hypothetical protein